MTEIPADPAPQQDDDLAARVAEWAAQPGKLVVLQPDRKPIAAAAGQNGSGSLVHLVICDDGSMWTRSTGMQDRGWSRIPNIPAGRDE